MKPTRTRSSWKVVLILILVNIITGLFFGSLLFALTQHVEAPLVITLTIFSLFLIGQGVFTFFLMSYAWSDPSRLEQLAAPEVFEEPKLSFTAIIPARHEEAVIAETILAMEKIRYPAKLKETLIVCHEDDTGTIKAVKETIAKIHASNTKLITFSGSILSKPHSLNVGLKAAHGEVIAVFDAEDEPHADIYSIVSTVMSRENADVVQGGVQLMNYQSKWFSLLNVLEYYFWFKSFLPFFSRVGLIPLGGNTVFFKRSTIVASEGWDESCLTEDCDIGIRLSISGAKISVVYDERHVTREETPATLATFIRQRTRWNQGFLQVFMKGDWTKLSSLSKRFLALFILLWPVVQALLLFYLPFAVTFLVWEKVPILLALLTSIPTYLLIFQLTALTVGMFEFCRAFGIRFSFLTPIKLILTFLPYQIVLGVSALRAFSRMMRQTKSWEKTSHHNLHREHSTGLSAQVTV